ncbi:methyltransferase domain-containing protein [Xanthobacter sp. V3C-3]|uniref:class I SAM-dependent methyltransferase n=1 Tax=Xanthobacter lutulentifluminis TaxID=3119935 RepID=UPI00372C1566
MPNETKAAEGRGGSLADRLLAVWDHLGLEAAHVATQMPGSLAGFAAAHPARIAGLLFHEPVGCEPAAFAAVASRLTVLAGDGGTSSQIAGVVAAALPESRRRTLEGYAQPGWADHVRDRTDEVVDALRDLPGTASPPARAPESGAHAGISYEIVGSGPALVLFPLFLAPTQWDAALPRLADHFTVIRLGGAHLGGVALLEDRASSPSYRGMFTTLLDIIAPAPTDHVLDVGAGSGALARIAARRAAQGAGHVTACDINAYMVKEGAGLAEPAGLSDRITFREADAEHLPFADAGFDHAYSVTVLEECDADRALSELFRVVKPGGRVGVIVRAIDGRHQFSADLPDAIRAKVEVVPPMVSPGGAADASLYRRMRAAGFRDLVPCPAMPSFENGSGFWRFIVGRLEPRLSAEELAVFRVALAEAEAAGTLFVTFPHHGIVGTKPGP